MPKPVTGLLTWQDHFVWDRIHSFNEFPYVFGSSRVSCDLCRSGAFPEPSEAHRGGPREAATAGWLAVCGVIVLADT